MRTSNIYRPQLKNIQYKPVVATCLKMVAGFSTYALEPHSQAPSHVTVASFERGECSTQIRQSTAADNVGRINRQTCKFSPRNHTPALMITKLVITLFAIVSPIVHHLLIYRTSFVPLHLIAFALSSWRKHLRLVT